MQKYSKKMEKSNVVRNFIFQNLPYGCYCSHPFATAIYCRYCQYCQTANCQKNKKLYDVVVCVLWNISLHIEK